jgi:methylated-DNA-protein-cysteine methyltransferase-like protein
LNQDWQAICAAVAAIPRGKVASYGQVALLAGLPGRARLVGRVLSHLPPGSEIPWQRVVNARGEISLADHAGARQRRLLEREGVRFNVHGRIDMRRYGIMGITGSRE